MNIKRSIQWHKLTILIIVWGFIGILVSIYDHFLLLSVISNSANTHYNLATSILFNLGIGVAAAILGGSFLVFFVHEKYRDSPYWKSIVLVGLSFIFVSSFLVLIVAYTKMIIKSGGSWNWALMKVYLIDPSHLKNALLWLLVLTLTQITLQINDKFGPRVLMNFILGKYHSPKEEIRIFMFVDLISSTAIAEKLGNEKYHRFLRDYFADMTNSILNNQVDIYQYVGDEVVISWRVTSGIVTNDCLQCYLDIQNTIFELKNKYKDRYGLVPEFRAGLHFGKVIMGEVGIIKREITFSGDVLNTTSRILGKCHEFNVKILVSDELLTLLPVNKFYHRISLGNIELRGKGTKVAISIVELGGI